MQVIVNVMIYDFDIFIPNGYVKFGEKIEEVGKMEDFNGHGTIIDGKGCMLTPGFVNAHNHCYTTFGRGWNASSNATDFLEMLNETWWKLDSLLDADEIYQMGLYCGREMLKNGITTVIEHHASGKKIEGSLELLKKALCEEMGMRGIFCFETSDRFSIEACIKENKRFIKENSTDQSAGIFGMNASFSLSDETLTEIEEVIGDAPIHIHVGESEADNEISLAKYHATPIQRLEEHGLLKENSILSHCIYLSEEDFRIIKKEDVYVAMNITSNLNNGLDVPDYKKFDENGIKCLLGCDGHGFNFAKEINNFYYVMKQKYKGKKEIGLNDLKQLIDNNNEYAEKLLGCKLGKIKKGYGADFVLCEYTNPTPMTTDNIIEHYWNGIIEQYHAKDVWCKGQQLLKDYKLVSNSNINDKHLIKKASKLWQEF
jgi:cytosine/adenosine deaminase-related metal-dependent hydrolase